MKTILVGVSPDGWKAEEIAVEIEHSFDESGSLIYSIESSIKSWRKTDTVTASRLGIHWCELIHEWMEISALLLSPDCPPIGGVRSIKRVDAVPIKIFEYPEE